MRPVLVALVDGVERARLEPPAAVAPRAWLLAIAAVQAERDANRVRARLRVHVTGAPAPTLVELPPIARVDIALIAPGEPVPAAPELEPPPPTAIALAVDGRPLAEARLTDATRAAEPPARAFGHVYTRWLRDGGHESGYDLTDFSSQPRGVKYERLARGLAAPPMLVSYLISTG